MSNHPHRSIYHFRRQALLLFFIVSLLPALTVSALWFIYTRDQSGQTLYSIGQFVAPIALLGLLPAVLLSLIFAELLARPVQRLQKAITQISVGNLNYRLDLRLNHEFELMAKGLNDIAENMQNILAQAQSEYDLVMAERAKLQVVLNSMNDGVVALDANHDIILYNKAAERLTGKPLSVAAGQDQANILNFDLDGHQVINEWLAGQAMTGEWKNARLNRPGQEELVANVQTVRIKTDPSGVRTLITFHDQSELYRLEEMKVDFVALAAHELRTPLTTIKGYLDLLQSEVGSKLDPDQQTFLERCSLSSDRLLKLTNNLLNVTKIENGSLSYNFEPVDWPEFLQQTIASLQELYRRSGRNIVIKAPKGLPKLSVDRSSISEVVNNLISNAITHSPDDSTITIAAKLSPDHRNIETTVTDTGSGIPADAINKLFTKFFRVEGLHAGQGTGLGLYISKHLVEAHGGHMWVESKPNKGSSFGFALPVKKIAKSDRPEHNGDDVIRGEHGWIKTPAHR